MDLTPETIEAKKRELAEVLVKRDNSARAVESLKEELKTERGYLASLDSLIRALSLEVATGKGHGDQLPLPTEPRSAAERTIPLPLDGDAPPSPEAPAVEAPKAKGSKGKGKGKGPASMALGDVIDRVLRAWGMWLDEDHLQAQVREELPLGAQPSTRDWTGVLRDMLAQGRLERREEDGRTQLRIPSAPAREEAAE